MRKGCLRAHVEHSDPDSDPEADDHSSSIFKKNLRSFCITANVAVLPIFFTRISDTVLRSNSL